MAEYAYPSELAQFVAGRWDPVDPATGDLSECGTRPEILEMLISACYQASMLREEARPVTFRMIVCRPECFGAAVTLPDGLHILKFSESRPFNPLELRALSQAAGFYRSLIGVQIGENGEPEIWGVVHTGPRWLRELYGGRRASTPLPSSVVICVNGPGYLEVCRGSVLVGQVRDGTVFDESMNVFQSNWLPELFAGERAKLLSEHGEMRAKEKTGGADIDPELTRRLGQQFVKRLISAVQAAHHGGTLIMVPENIKDTLLEPNPYLKVKYRFAESEARARYRALMLSILGILAAESNPAKPAGWQEYERSADRQLGTLDEALFEMSYLIAGLTAVDGAVLMTKRFEVLGFGAEITCHEVSVPHVARALDTEGESVLKENPDGVGTRHRSAFRFAQSFPSALTVVVSQDGDVRFVRFRDGEVTYWTHRPSLQVTP